MTNFLRSSASQVEDVAELYSFQQGYEAGDLPSGGAAEPRKRKRQRLDDDGKYDKDELDDDLLDDMSDDEDQYVKIKKKKKTFFFYDSHNGIVAGVGFNINRVWGVYCCCIPEWPNQRIRDLNEFLGCLPL